MEHLTLDDDAVMNFIANDVFEDCSAASSFVLKTLRTAFIVVLKSRDDGLLLLFIVLNRRN